MVDKINSIFQSILDYDNFPLKMIEEETQWIYQGLLEVNENHQIGFIVSIGKGSEKVVGQIVYNRIASNIIPEKHHKILETINHLNNSKAVYYHFGLSNDKSMYMRHVALLTEDIENFFEVLKIGPSLIADILADIES